MRLDCISAFGVSFSKSEMWIMPIIKPNNWNIGPHHGQLDFDWQTLELELVEALCLDLFTLSYNFAFNLLI